MIKLVLRKKKNVLMLYAYNEECMNYTFLSFDRMKILTVLNMSPNRYYEILDCLTDGGYFDINTLDSIK